MRALSKGRTVTEYGRLRRDVRRRFAGEAAFRDQLDQASVVARPAPLRGKRLRYAVTDAAAEHTAAERAEVAAKELALATVAELASAFARLELADTEDERHGIDVGGLLRDASPADPVAELVDAVDESRPEFTATAVTILAQLGAAAVLQLGKDHHRAPDEVVRALLATYFPDEVEG
jgi:hypothetical protein